MLRKISILGLAALSVAVSGCEDDDDLFDPNRPVTFTVRVENVDAGALNTSQGPKPVPLSPGAWAVHTGPNPIFTPETAADEALENIAEDGFPEMEVMQLQGRAGVTSAGAFQASTGGPPITPGQAAEFTITATPGERLSIATMFVQSNDLFYAPDASGIPLFAADGSPLSGDATPMLILWDAGTEVNQEPGVGDAQKPRQPNPDFGPVEGDVVRPVREVNDNFNYPPNAQVIRVTITP